MLIKNRLINLIFILFIGLNGTGCKKYLDVKPDKQLAVPERLQDLQALLDYYTRISNSDPGSIVASVDDYYIRQEDYDGLYFDADKRIYIWENKNLFDNYMNDWSYQYDIVNSANTVLDNISKIKRTINNSDQWDNIKGQALLLRARSFQWITWIWANSYDKSSSRGELGIPLRLHSDFNVPSVRSTLEETYKRIITDLKESLLLLPVIPVHMFRGSRPAGYALLARCYLSMRDYKNAGLYADSSLQLFSNLIDYNSLNPGANYPFPRFNEEIIMENRIPIPSLIIPGIIDSMLYRLYKEDDLRKLLFFKKNNNGHFSFRGSYEGTLALFSGIATDEVILMKAECLARSGNVSDAMNELNSLLIKRWKKNSFVPLTAIDENDALRIILDERRKELLMRGLRWMDIKRLNKEGAGIIMKRVINGATYTLSPNDLKYALPIPEEVINLSGMQQNPK